MRAAEHGSINPPPRHRHGHLLANNRCIIQKNIHSYSTRGNCVIYSKPTNGDIMKSYYGMSDANLSNEQPSEWSVPGLFCVPNVCVCIMCIHVYLTLYYLGVYWAFIQPNVWKSTFRSSNDLISLMPVSWVHFSCSKYSIKWLVIK